MYELKSLREFSRDIDELLAVQAPSEIRSTISMWQSRIDGARAKGCCEDKLAKYVAKVEEMRTSLGDR